MGKRIGATPFIKWAGGKRRLVEKISSIFPPDFKDYYEPFVGGGALFFHMGDRARSCHLSDTNEELISSYKVISCDPKNLIIALKKHEKKHDRGYYMKMREMGFMDDEIQISARFLYLNKTCFNGLYRVNKKGHFNVPIGSYKNPKICDEEGIMKAHEALKNTEINLLPFNKIKPKKDDLVYCDPPYHGKFDGYTKEGFDEDSHKSLRDSCVTWRGKGVKVIVSNSNNEFISSLYRGFNLNILESLHSISGKGDVRGNKAELLITGYDIVHGEKGNG